MDFIERDDSEAKRFWTFLVNITSGYAIQAGVPVQALTGSVFLRDRGPMDDCFERQSRPT